MNTDHMERSGIHEHVVRRLRYLRCAEEPVEEQQRVAQLYARILLLDWHKLLAEAARPGPLSL